MVTCRANVQVLNISLLVKKDGTRGSIGSLCGESQAALGKKNREKQRCVCSLRGKGPSNLFLKSDPWSL